MTALLWIFRIAVFLFLLGFAIKNSAPISVRFYLDTVWHAPLVLVLFLAFGLGVLVGLGTLTGTVIRLRKASGRVSAEGHVNSADASGDLP